MRVPFLRREGVELGPLDADEARRCEAMPTRLASHGQADVALAARSGSDLVGVLTLEGIDWTRRRARLGARWVDGAPLARASSAHACEYAFDELNLDAVEAVVVDDAWRPLLVEAGFERVGGPLLTRIRAR